MSFEEQQIGPVRVIFGDSLLVLPTILVGTVGSVITDPPYGISETAGGPQSNAREKGNYAGSFEDTQQYVSEVCAAVIRQCIEMAPRVALTCGRTNLWHYPPATDVGCFYQPAATGCSFWGRPTWQPILFYGTAPNSGEQLRSLHYVLTESPPVNGHPCPKPLKAWEWLVQKASKVGDMILDPFAGSMTTGVACINTDRKAILIEKERKYFDEGCKRLERAWADRCDRLPFDQPDRMTQRTFLTVE